MTSEGEHLDGDVAESLTSAAKETLEKPQSDDAPAKDSPASELNIQNVAHIVLDKSNHAAYASRAYIENVVHKVQDYAQNVASGATGSTSNIQETLSKAVHVGAYPGSTTGTPGEGDASSGSDGGLLTSVATWCSSLCGSKNDIAAGGEPRSVDLRAAAENTAEVLHSSTSSTTSSTTSSSVETPSPHAVAPAETSPELEPASSEPAKPPSTPES